MLSASDHAVGKTATHVCVYLKCLFFQYANFACASLYVYNIIYVYSHVHNYSN